MTGGLLAIAYVFLGRMRNSAMGTLNIAFGKTKSQAELEKIPQRLLSTGVYSDVAMHLQPSIAVAATSRTRDVDLVIELKESHHRLETGIQRASDGQFQTALEGSALNWFGSAERFSVSLASAKGDLNLGHLADVRYSADAALLPFIKLTDWVLVYGAGFSLLFIFSQFMAQALSSTPSAGQLVRDKTGALAKDFLTPTLKAEFKKPTLGVYHHCAGYINLCITQCICD